MKKERRYTKGLSLVLVFTLLVTMFQVPWAEKVRADDWFGGCFPNYQKNIVKFIVNDTKVSENDTVYVAGDFNNWSPGENGEKYKLKKQPDPDDNNKEKMMLILEMKKERLGSNFESGFNLFTEKNVTDPNKKHRYKFVHNDAWRNNKGNENTANETFEWHKSTPVLENANTPVLNYTDKKVTFSIETSGTGKAYLGHDVNGTWETPEMNGEDLTNGRQRWTFELPMSNKENKTYQFQYMLEPYESPGEDRVYYKQDKNQGGNSNLIWNDVPAVTPKINRIAVVSKENSNHVECSIEAEGYSQVWLGIRKKDTTNSTTVFEYKQLSAGQNTPNVYTDNFDMTNKENGAYEYTFKLLPIGKNDEDGNWVWATEENKDAPRNSEVGKEFQWEVPRVISLSHEIVISETEKKVIFKAEIEGFKDARVGYQTAPGEKNSWVNEKMISAGGKQFTYTQNMENYPNGVYEFKFSFLPKWGNESTDGDWEWYKENKEKGGTDNSSFEWTIYNPQINSATAIPMEEENKVSFVIVAADYGAAKVLLKKGGSTDWEPHDMTETSQGFKLLHSMDGKENGTYWYKFSLLPKGKESNNEANWKVVYEGNVETDTGNSKFTWDIPRTDVGEITVTEPTTNTKAITFKIVAKDYDKVQVRMGRDGDTTWQDYDLETSSTSSGEYKTYTKTITLADKTNGKYWYKFKLLPRKKDAGVDSNWQWLNKEKDKNSNSEFDWYIYHPSVTSAGHTVKETENKVKFTVVAVDYKEVKVLEKKQGSSEEWTEHSMTKSSENTYTFDLVMDDRENGTYSYKFKLLPMGKEATDAGAWEEVYKDKASDGDNSKFDWDIPRPKVKSIEAPVLNTENKTVTFSLKARDYAKVMVGVGQKNVENTWVETELTTNSPNTEEFKTYTLSYNMNGKPNKTYEYKFKFLPKGKSETPNTNWVWMNQAMSSASNAPNSEFDWAVYAPSHGHPTEVVDKKNDKVTFTINATDYQQVKLFVKAQNMGNWDEVSMSSKSGNIYSHEYSMTNKANGTYLYKVGLLPKGQGSESSNWKWAYKDGVGSEADSTFLWNIKRPELRLLKAEPDLERKRVIFTVVAKDYQKIEVGIEKVGVANSWQEYLLNGTSTDTDGFKTYTYTHRMDNQTNGIFGYKFKVLKEKKYDDEEVTAEYIKATDDTSSKQNSEFTWTPQNITSVTAARPDLQTKKVSFSLVAKGYSRVMVGVGFKEDSQVTDWTNYKMEKQNSPENTYSFDLSMTGKKNGTYVYKYALLPEGINKSENSAPDGDWTWVNKDNQDGDNSTFEWNLPEERAEFEIKASGNFVSENDPVELLAVKVDDKKNISLVDGLTWKIEPAVAGAKIENNVLTVESGVAVNTELNLKAYKAGAEEKTARKTIRVVADAGTDKVLVHFLKQDVNYNGWNCWVYPLNPDQRMDFTNDSDMGKTAYLPKGKKVIVRRSEGSAEWLEQTKEYALPESGDVYIIKDDNHLYTSFQEAFLASGPRIRAAVMDKKTELKAFLTEAPVAGVNFELYVNNVKQNNIISQVNTAEKSVVLSGITNFDPTALYEVKADNMFTKYHEVTLRNVLDDYVYQGDDMGVKYEGEKVNFRIWAPTAHKVELLTFGDISQSKESPTGTYQMTHNAASGTYHLTENKGNVDGKYYLYRLTFHTRTAAGEFTTRQTYAVDPYAIATGLNGKMGYITDINAESLKPTDWDATERPKLERPEDSILYEMHVRDFTISPNWGGDRTKAGKFLGVAEEGTTYSKDGKTVKTGLDHLKELGVTHVHLLPVYDIASIEEDGDHSFDAKKAGSEAFNRNWGYDPQNYNALEGSYSTKPEDPALVIKEFRTMVQKLHQSGIRVVLDKVYNHMYSTENMDKIVPGYYFRSFEDGKLSNGSGCGNEVASERPMVRKFIVDSNKMWIKNYKVDGLRFDLMALLDKETMNQVQREAKKVDPSIIVYGEPWKADHSPLADNDQTKKGNAGIAAFNDDFRNALRGDNSPSKGFIQGAISSENAGKVHEGLRGSVNGTVGDPELIINYVEAHDNYAIWDQVEKSDKGTANGQFRKSIPENPLSDWRVNKTLLASGFVLTAQGIPFFQGGSEILRTKQGDHNSYISSDTINAIHWEDKVTYQKVFDFYRDLIRIRKEHPAFRMKSKSDIDGNQSVNRLMNRDDLVFNYMKNNAGGDKWKNIVVIYNGSIGNVDVNWLPKTAGKKWHILFDKDGLHETNQKVVTQNENGTLTQNLSFPSSSFMILYDEEGKADNIQWDYLFADQSADYMIPLEPSATDAVKVRFRAAAGEVTEAKVHYYDEADSAERTLPMAKITDDNFYTEKGFDKTKVEFWEGEIPASGSCKYYQFEVINGTKKAYISGGVGENNRGVTNSKPNDKGFWIVPDYKTPDWTKEAVFYQIMVDRFRDGDSKNNRVAKDVSRAGNPSEVSEWGSPIYRGTESDMVWNNQFFGGDLIGVKEALPYFKYLGVDSLYLMPIFQSGSDHKYDADDYEFVDKNFGGNASLASLSKAMESEHMKLVLDGVFNHTSTEGDLFKNHKADYYFYEKGAYRDKATPQNQIDFYPWHGYTNLAKLNYSKQGVRDYIYNGENAIAKRYLRAPYNIDGWRLDAAEDVNTEPRDYKRDAAIDIKTNQTDEQQKAENLKIWKEFRTAVKGVKEDVFILGEFWEDENQWYKERAWDSKMNYGGFMMPFLENNSGNSYLGRQSLDNKGDKSVADLGKYTRDYFAKFPYQTILTATNSISTHDKERFLNREFAGEGNKQMMQLAVALQMTYPGVPMIYYGDEIGTRGRENGKDPYNRGTFNWDVNSWNDASKQMFKDHKTLIETRKKNKDAFVYGAFEEIASHNDDKYIAYARYGKGNRSITILNNNGSAGSQSIKLEKLERYGFKDGEKLYDVLSNEAVTISGGEATFPSQNMSASVWVLEGKKPSRVGEITFNLDELSDERTKLNPVKEPKFEVKENQIQVTWEVVSEVGAKEISVSLYDGDKRLEEKVVELSQTSVSFEKKANLPESFTVQIKVMADRKRKLGASLTDDMYADSDFVKASKKEETPETPGGNENQTPGGNENQTPGGNENQTPGGNENQTPGGNENQTPGGNENQTPGGNENQTPGGNENQQEEAPKKEEYYYEPPVIEESSEEKQKEDPSDEKKEKESSKDKTAELKEEDKDIPKTKEDDQTAPKTKEEVKDSTIVIQEEQTVKAVLTEDKIQDVMNGEADKLVVKLKTATVEILKTTLREVFGNDEAETLQIEVKKLKSTSKKVDKKELKKRLKANTLLKKQVFNLVVKANGKSLNKFKLGKNKLTVNLKVKIKKAPKKVFVMDVKSGKLLKAKYDVKKKVLTFNTNKVSRYVIVKRAKKVKATR